MESNYTRWHPDHICFEWRKGPGVARGNVFYFEETITGEHQKKEVAFTDVIPDRYLEFAPTNGFFRLFLPRISFEMKQIGSKTELVAQVVIRMGPIAAWFHKQQIALVRQHMCEEGENLKKLVEAA